MRVLLRVALASAVLPLIAPCQGLVGNPPASKWQIERVDESGVGRFSSLKIDTKGNAHLAYVTDDGTDSLKYAFWDHTVKRWFVMTVAHGASFSSLALDSHGRPHISYADAGMGSGAKLRHAFWDGAKWQIQAIPLNSDIIGYYTSIGLDSHDNPAISFYEYRGPRGTDLAVRLRIVKWNGKIWELRTLDGDNQSGKFNSLAIDSGDHIHVAYANVNAAEMGAGIRYAYWNGGTWAVEDVDDREKNFTPMMGYALVGYSADLALDRDGNPHITYMNYSVPALKYAVRRSGQWNVQTVERLSGVGYLDRNAIVIDDNGNPYIGYLDPGQGVLKVAHLEEGRWKIEVVDGGGAGLTSSLQIHDGVLWISYADEPGACLKVARRPITNLETSSGADATSLVGNATRAGK